MNKIALSAIIATVTTVCSFQVMLMAYENISNITLTAVTIAALTFSFIFTFAVAFFVAIATFISTTITIAILTAITTLSAFTCFITALVIFIAASAAFSIAHKLNIPYKWVFGIYVMETVTLIVVFLTGAFLTDSLAISMSTTIVGCSLIAGIWWMYNRKHPPLPIPANS